MSKRYLQWGYESFKDNKTGEICDNYIDLLNQQSQRIAELEEQLANAIVKIEFLLQKKKQSRNSLKLEGNMSKYFDGYASFDWNKMSNQKLVSELKEKCIYIGKLKQQHKEEFGAIQSAKDKKIADLQSQLAITEKALELACEHIKEDLKCDDTQDEIYNYFKNKAKEMLENEQ